MPRIEKYKLTVVAVGRMKKLGGARRATVVVLDYEVVSKVGAA